MADITDASPRLRSRQRRTQKSSAKRVQLISLINRAARMTNKAARLRLGPLGAWPGQIPLLIMLFDEDGLIQKELVQRSGMEQPTVAEHLDRLERDGFIIRRQSTDDKRKYRVFLTAKTKGLSRDLLEGLRTGADAFTADIDDQDLEIVERSLGSIISRLEQFILTFPKDDPSV